LYKLTSKPLKPSRLTPLERRRLTPMEQLQVNIRVSLTRRYPLTLLDRLKARTLGLYLRAYLRLPAPARAYLPLPRLHLSLIPPPSGTDTTP